MTIEKNYYEIFKKEISNKELKNISFETINKDYKLISIDHDYLILLNNTYNEMNKFYEIVKKYNYNHYETLNKYNIENEYNKLRIYLMIIYYLKKN